jgi:hypothetical protein
MYAMAHGLAIVPLLDGALIIASVLPLAVSPVVARMVSGVCIASVD